MTTVFTIGHSNLSVEAFFALLEQHENASTERLLWPMVKTVVMLQPLLEVLGGLQPRILGSPPLLNRGSLLGQSPRRQGVSLCICVATFSPVLFRSITGRRDSRVGASRECAAGVHPGPRVRVEA